MTDVLTTIRSIGLVPVIRLDFAEQAAGLGRALVDGGLPLAEVTFRTAAAPAAIASLRKDFPGILVGAGTIITLEQARMCVDAGAAFAVTPGFNPKIVEFFLSKDIPIIPGVNSPTQVEMGLEYGLHVLKFFPAEASGGVRMLKALAGPYAEVQFIPTGGVEVSNLSSYLELPNVLACGGSWMVKDDLIRGGQLGELSRLCRQAVELVRSIRGK